MAERLVFTGSGLMTKTDVKNFIKLFEMNQVEAELSNDKSTRCYTITITEKEI